ncbi:MAG: hypothetical protein BGN86_17095 [Caulobacterales bacterium 68-7]|nr:MAG: hypothetical protein BGN86_17095 [Caulobacterales bacterium 68-7]
MGSAIQISEREATLNYCLDMLEQIGQLLERGAGEPDLGRIVHALVKSQRSYGDVTPSSSARLEELRSFHLGA